MKKKILACIAGTTLGVTCLTGCSLVEKNFNNKNDIFNESVDKYEDESYVEEDRDDEAKKYEDEDESEKEDTTSNMNIKSSSSISDPIKMGETGVIYKKNYTTDKYEKVYITIDELVKKDAAEKIIKSTKYGDAFEKSKKDGFEYAVIKYTLDMKDYPTTYETKVSVYYSVRGMDGKSIKYNDKIYILSGTDITDYEDAEGVQGDKIDRLYATYLPEGYDQDFLLEVSEYDADGNSHKEYFYIEN